MKGTSVFDSMEKPKPGRVSNSSNLKPNRVSQQLSSSNQPPTTSAKKVVSIAIPIVPVANMHLSNATINAPSIKELKVFTRLLYCIVFEHLYSASHSIKPYRSG